MGKYIVELKKNETLYKATTRESDGTAYVCSAIGTPYVNPDLEQVREEAYQKGLSDAWEAARKICAMDSRSRDEIFGAVITTNILDHNSASKALEEIRAHEQAQKEKEEQIQAGDEVENTQTGVKFIVTHIWENNRGEQGVSGFNQECSSFSTALSLVFKTGRHFPEIAEVLQKMREGQEQ